MLRHCLTRLVSPCGYCSIKDTPTLHYRGGLGFLNQAPKASTVEGTLLYLSVLLTALTGCAGSDPHNCSNGSLLNV